MKTRNKLTVVLFSILLLGAIPAVMRAQGCSGPYLVEQRFPVNTALPEETRWRFCFQRVRKNGLVINAAFFRKSPASPWVQVIYDARVAELFVPYHSGSPRFRDMSGFNFGLFQLTPRHCPRGVGGTLLDNDYVCKEVHDRGLAWTNYSDVRRGEELVLWGGIGAGNYNYIIEWTFRDDGVMLGRVGATATNYGGGQALEAHMHGIFWRLDIDLNGFPGDTVEVVSHRELGLTAGDPATMVRNEASFEWNPQAFTSLMVHDSTLKNAQGHASGYDLMPARTGTPRHQEDFTRRDFWVTKYKYSEMLVPDLPKYIVPAEPVAGNDVVIWYYSAAHHLPRDEDGRYVGNTFEPLVAHVMWTGFMLKPHNLFDKTPLYP
ncbi:MAG: copper amine oxidase [Acidobacteria bacterium]|nr:copper amine oxidase [Acidobacteriota bacterium]